MTFSLSQLQAMARATATKYGLDPNIFGGLVSQESSWDINAVGDGGAAYGLTQMHNPALTDVGYTRADLIGNPANQLDAGAQYLKQQLDRFGNYDDALGAYNQGAGDYNNTAAKDYAASVEAKAGGTPPTTGEGWLSWARGKMISAEHDMMTSLGFSDKTASLWTDPNTSATDLVENAVDFNGWFGRISIAVFAILLIGAALLMLGKNEITTAAQVAA